MISSLIDAPCPGDLNSSTWASLLRVNNSSPADGNQPDTTGIASGFDFHPKLLSAYKHWDLHSDLITANQVRLCNKSTLPGAYIKAGFVCPDISQMFSAMH